MSEITVKSKVELSSIILTLIGGTLIIVGGVLFFAWNYSWVYMDNRMMDDDMMMANMMHGMWMMNDRFWFNAIGIMSLSSVASGAIVTISGLMMYFRPNDSHKWGIVALVFSVFGFFGMGGFIVGSMLGILGGILALFKRQGI